MEQEQSTNSTEQRRKLLKGALGASSVMSLGYSGAALASFDCVAKQRSGVPIFPGQQFRSRFFGVPAPTSTSGNWAWQNIKINVYKPQNTGGNCSNGTNGLFFGYVLNNTLYRINLSTGSPSTLPPYALAILPVTNLGPVATFCFVETRNYDAWVLAYFWDDGSLRGYYPDYSLAGVDQTPATGSCLTSLNVNMDQTNITYGG